MIDELMPASEKRKQYESAQDAKSQAELKKVIGLINNTQGLCIYLDKALSDPVKAILESKGYTCGYVQTGMNESEYKVSW